MKRGFSIFVASLAAMVVMRVAVMLVAPVFEPSEARYAAISANMARTGDWFVPSLRRLRRDVLELPLAEWFDVPGSKVGLGALGELLSLPSICRRSLVESRSCTFLS